MCETIRQYWEIPLMDWFGSNACNHRHQQDELVSDVSLEKDLATKALNSWTYSQIEAGRCLRTLIFPLLQMTLEHDQNNDFLESTKFRELSTLKSTDL